MGGCEYGEVIKEVMRTRGIFRGRFSTLSVGEIVEKVSKLDRCCYDMVNDMGNCSLANWERVEEAIGLLYRWINGRCEVKSTEVYGWKDEVLRNGKIDVYGVLFEWEVKVRGFLRNGSFYFQDGVDMGLR